MFIESIVFFAIVLLCEYNFFMKRKALPGIILNHEQFNINSILDNTFNADTQISFTSSEEEYFGMIHYNTLDT